MKGLLVWLFKAVTGRGCLNWQKHDWDPDSFDPWSLMTECRRCGYVG